MIGGNRGGDNREEADLWLVESEKLLASSDFHGAKTSAIRACKADPSLADAADYIIAISDTLLAGESTIGDSNLPDWYTILRLVHLTQNPEHIATQYRRLSLLLNRTINRLPFADQALKLVTDAWCVLSDPLKKSVYDLELQMSQIDQLGQSQQFQWGQDSPLQSQSTSFWTVCRYCYASFEYPKGYEECIMRCQLCNRAFEAVTTQTPPVESIDQGVYFCSWPMFPLGFSDHAKTSHLAPPRNYCDNDDDNKICVVISDDECEGDDEANVNKKTKIGEGKVSRNREMMRKSPEDADM